MHNESTIQEVEFMIQSTLNTREENLRLQSLTTNHFMLNTLADHYYELTKDLAELESMLANHSDFVLATR